eukprot:c11005_g1_i1.p1 GENE.c11005_g1_i1~~c11005_g1_i1.p1  ORF type:complete len:1385 (+),score=292.59 c11005_g1_i1:330-4157(+)
MFELEKELEEKEEAGDEADGGDDGDDGEGDLEDSRRETVEDGTERESSKPNIPKLVHTASMIQRAEDTWERMRDQTNQEQAAAAASSSTASTQETSKPAPEVPQGPVTWDHIRKEMHLSSSPLVFFNLACFQGAGEADLDVMHPICGYAVAGRLLAVMGPPGTDTSTLRVALSDFPKDPSNPNQREVLVADFTVKDLFEVCDSILRPDDVRPDVSLISHFGLEKEADVQIGTCIQRGASDLKSTMGTPRGSRNPEMPTPRNPTTPRFRGTQAAVQKSVLLMEDLMSVLDAEAIYKVLLALNKIAVAKRASVIITLNKPFERRGLFSMFDDCLIFTQEGVSYFGPTKHLTNFLGLIGSPCPHIYHPTDHIHTVSNIAAKYDECQIKKFVDTVILEYTGTREQPEQQADDRQGKSSKPLIPSLLRKKKRPKNQLPEPLENSAGGGLSSRARRLANKLAKERRERALMEKAQEKLNVWQKLTELDQQIARGNGDREPPEIRNFEQMLLELRSDTKRQRPSCFMNLACFMNIDGPPDKMLSSVIQPTCAFANEGHVMGVLGPPGSDASNLLASLRFGSEHVTTVTEISVRDTLKLSEFLKKQDREETAKDLDDSVEMLMAKMMLTACSQELIGTLIQRGNSKASASTRIEIGDTIMSTAVRSILLLDQIHSLDAQSLFVVLKLIKRIAVPARLAIIFMLNTPEEAQGLFALLDNILLFSEEGVGYFGPARFLAPYCALVGFPCPEGVHVTTHFTNVMQRLAPSQYVVSETNIETPFTVRYQHSALFKYNKDIIDISTKPQSEGGLSARTLMPKSFRKKTARGDNEEAVIEKAELARQRFQREVQLKLEQEDKRRELDSVYEKVWQQLAQSDPSIVNSATPLAAGLDGIVAEMDTGDQKPSLFFNLACFFPNVLTERVDLVQPICGYALIGRIVGILGPPDTDLGAFLAALSGSEPPTARSPQSPAKGGEMPPPPSTTPRVGVLHRPLTVFELLKIAESTRSDRGSQPLHDSANTLLQSLGLSECAEARIGTFIQRGLSTTDLGAAKNPEKQMVVAPSILMLDKISDSLDAQSSFVVLKLVKRIAAQAQMAVIVHLPKPAERRGLFPLVDDCLVFCGLGVGYFGPAQRLRDFLSLVNFPCPDNVHETDFLFDLFEQYGDEDDSRPLTNTSPVIRYKYSSLSKYVESVVERYTKPAANDYDLQSSRGDPSATKRGTTFIPKGTRNPLLKRITKAKGEERKRLEEEDAANRRTLIAEREAEAERQRCAEADAERVWRDLMKK